MNQKKIPFISIGKVVGTFGLDGTLKVETFTDFPERFKKGAHITIEKKIYTIKSSFWHKNQVRLALEEINTLDAAELLRGKHLMVPSHERPKLASNEFYSIDLIGLKIYDQEHHLIGNVDEIIDSPAHHLIRTGQVHIPANKVFVKEINIEQGYIKVHLIPGMLDS